MRARSAEGLLDAGKKPAYTAWLYNVDSGTIFEAGTTKVVGSIIQSSLLGPDGNTMRDRELHEALQPVLL